MHFHKYVWDSQGAIYCKKCRKLKGWKEGKITISHEVDPVTQKINKIKSGWGYLLNGKTWRGNIEKKIKKNGGKYLY